jgi:hypothetical protein
MPARGTHTLRNTVAARSPSAALAGSDETLLVRLNRGRLVFLMFAVGCAATVKQAPKASHPPVASAPPRARMAWMPCDARAQPELAAAVNGRLERAKVAGVGESFQASVSMEMAQLAIECIEKTPRCYSAVGRSIGADRLLWAHLDRAPQGELTLRVSLFDVERGAIVSVAKGHYPTAQAAAGDVAALVTRAQTGEQLADAGKTP